MSIDTRRVKTGVRYDVRLRDPSGRTYNRTFRTKREAETYQARELADRSRGAWVDPRCANTTFAELATAWLGINPTKSPATIARDEAIVRCHLVPALGSRTLASLTPADVQRLVHAWSQKMAPRTVRRTYSILRAILNYAVEAELVTRSPCRGVKLPAADAIEYHPVDVDALVRLGDALGREYRALPYLAAVLGLRWGECAGLSVGRLDFMAGMLTVAEQLTRGERGLAVLRVPKSAAGRRTLAVPPALMAILAEHLARRGLTGADADALVFAAADGGPLHYSNFRQRVWLPATRQAGLDGLTFHDLRRANATAMVLDGVDVKTAQARLGHSDPRMTLAIYAQATQEGDRVAAERLGGRFLNGTRDERAMTGTEGSVEERPMRL